MPGLALWNGQDPILKERLFGLTNAEGNHGEDVKEHYCYLDGTPTHSYMRMLYKYPQAAFPYDNLVAENARRGKLDREFELHDTGVFDGGRYFDIFVEYAKADTDDILMRIEVHNRAATPAVLHLLPQLWARNTWAWTGRDELARVVLQADGSLLACRAGMTEMRLQSDAADEILFCDNETNTVRLFGAAPPPTHQPGGFKDGIGAYIVHGDAHAIRRDSGSKVAIYRTLTMAPGATAVMRLRFRPASDTPADFTGFDAVLARRLEEADAFYAALQSAIPTPGERLVHRQALAGMLWSKQFYDYDVALWLKGDPAEPSPPPERMRNAGWTHLNNADIISMPDTWEYPWYAAWDLAFQSVTLANIDPDFAKGQLLLLTREWYMHPNGQLPAYEWAFGDVNPPVHAWAALRVYRADQELTGTVDTGFLERVFHKLLLNFTWWVNRTDSGGRNVFQGGFLGLDNIEMFDRSQPLPTGGRIDQADGTAWMAMYCAEHDAHRHRAGLHQSGL